MYIAYLDHPQNASRNLQFGGGSEKESNIGHLLWSDVRLFDFAGITE